MLCRLCLHESNQDTSVLLYANDDESAVTKFIAKYLKIEVSQNDGFSSIICTGCYQHLIDFHEFFQFVEQRQLQNDFLKVNCIGTESSTENWEHGGHNEMESLLDVKDIIIEEEKNYEASPNIEFGFAANCKDLDSQNVNDFEVGDGTENVMKSQIKRKRLGGKKKTITERRCENSKPKSHRCVKEVFVNENESKCGDNFETCTESSPLLTQDVKQPSNLVTPEESKNRNKVIEEYLRLKCDICKEPAKDLADLRLHFRNAHNRKAYVTCCGRRFHRRFLLVDHIQVHLNPEHFKCVICKKVFKTKVNLEMHNANIHKDKSELKYPCTHCDRRFAHTTNLMAHLTHHTNERNYRCEICNKAFKSKNVLKVHMNSVHEEITPYICDICGKEYKKKLSFDRHSAEHKGQSNNIPKIQCKICGELFSKYYFPRHTKLHEDISVDCDRCGKTFKSRATLNYHIANTHEAKRVYSCTICDKTFLRAEYLKEHINRHTGEKIFSCSYCPSEFRSKASMYGHVKRSHFEQWKLAKLTKKSNNDASKDTNNEIAS